MTEDQRQHDAENATGPLAGISVLDLSRVLAGPYCAQLLADQGATVVKVEAPHGDETRGWGPPFSPGGESAYYLGLNRNKRNLCLDLDDSRGRDVLWRLLSRSDVVIENFKPSTVERWGIGYDEVARRFPGVVYCSIRGFGREGPLGDRPGYDAAAQAYGGLMSINGEATGPPLRMGTPVVDIFCGATAFGAICAALLRRERSGGKGDHVESVLLDAALNLLHPHAAAFLASDHVAVRTGAAHPMVAPYQTFETSTGALFVGASNQQQFARFARVVGRAELVEDERFATNADRVVNRQALALELADALAPRDAEALAAELLDAGVPAAPVHDVRQALESPQVTARGLVVSDGEYRGIRDPIRFASQPQVPVRRPEPRGGSSRTILRDAGLLDIEIDELVSSGVVCEATPGQAP